MSDITYSLRTRKTTQMRPNTWWAHRGPSTTFTPTLNRLYVQALFPEGPMAMANVGIRVNTVAGAGGIARFAIYNDTGENYPGAKLTDSANIDTTITGARTAAFYPYTFNLPIVWLAMVFQVAVPNVYGRSAAVGLQPLTTVLDVASNHICMYTDTITGVPPTSYSTTLLTTPDCPAVALQTAA